MTSNKVLNKKTIAKLRSRQPLGDCEIHLGYGFLMRFSSEKPDGISGADDYRAELLKRYESGDEIIIKTVEETIFSYKKKVSMVLHFQKKAYRIMLGIIMNHFGTDTYEKQRKEIINNVHGFR